MTGQWEIPMLNTEHAQIIRNDLGDAFHRLMLTG
jgi:hypothetical protein